MIYDLLSLSIIGVSTWATVLMFGRARVGGLRRGVYCFAAVTCLYFAVFYFFMFLSGIEVSILTAAFGRGGILLILTSIIALGIMQDK